MLDAALVPPSVEKAAPKHVPPPVKASMALAAPAKTDMVS